MKVLFIKLSVLIFCVVIAEKIYNSIPHIEQKVEPLSVRPTATPSKEIKPKNRMTEQDVVVIEYMDDNISTTPVSANHLYPAGVRQNCVSKAPSRKRETKEAIYTWVDQDGVTHFSNQASQSLQQEISVIEYEVDDYFSIELNNHQSSLTTTTLQKIEYGITNIYRFLIDVVGIQETRHITLKTRFIDDKNEFHLYRNKNASSSLATATEYYSTKNNELVIYSGISEKATIEISLHEATHAIIAALFGYRTPIWLNEGLATYFESIGYTIAKEKTVHAATARINYLKTLQPPKLGKLIKYTPKEWYQKDRAEMHYSTSWALVWYLMSTREGKKAITSMLEQLSRDSCAKIDSMHHIQKALKKDMLTIERDWYQWLKQPMAATQQFY